MLSPPTLTQSQSQSLKRTSHVLFVLSPGFQLKAHSVHCLDCCVYCPPAALQLSGSELALETHESCLRLPSPLIISGTRNGPSTRWVFSPCEFLEGLAIKKSLRFLRGSHPG